MTVLETEAEARLWIENLPACAPPAIQRLECLIGMLAQENLAQNLVSKASLDQVWLRHIADSAQLIGHVPRGISGPWLDLGTGAGFPGLVIAALCPEREVVMVESRARRVEWLNRARDAMGLTNARVAGQRLELLEARPVAVISARAFAPLEKLLTVSERFSTSDTVFLLPKGQSARQELDNLSSWRHAFHVEQSVTDPHAGIIVGTLAGRKGKAT